MYREPRLDPTISPEEEKLEQGTALCLSGGGYRAMLFHLGGLWRLNQLGILGELKRVSSVSGGSIAAGVLGSRWKQLEFTRNVAQRFGELVVKPIRALASKTIDVGAIVIGTLLPGVHVSDRVEAAYRKYLFGDLTLQDLPADGDGPRFVLNATSLQTGALFRFSRPYMADYLVGRFLKPKVKLAKAVAASSAFPPFLSPVILPLDGERYEEGSGNPAYAEFRHRAVLTDGGVYDNMGLETAWKRYETVLVSDGGARMPPELGPAKDWARGTVRVLGVIDNQVRSLRKRIAVDAFDGKLRQGTYFGIGTNIADYGLPSAIPVSQEHSLQLAHFPTRLSSVPAEVQERLINWGFAVCDAAIRRWVRPAATPPSELPYPKSGI